MTTVEVTSNHDYRQPAERLWAAFADPVIAATLDDRVTLVSMAGEAGTVSSSYELDVAVGPLRMRQQVEVVQAVPPALLKTVTSMQGRVAAVQTARIAPTDTGSRVTWTVTMETSWLGAGLRRRKAKKESPKWLAAAEAASTRSRKRLSGARGTTPALLGCRGTDSGSYPSRVPWAKNGTYPSRVPWAKNGTYPSRVPWAENGTYPRRGLRSGRGHRGG